MHFTVTCCEISWRSHFCVIVYLFWKYVIDKISDAEKCLLLQPIQLSFPENATNTNLSIWHFSSVFEQLFIQKKILQNHIKESCPIFLQTPGNIWMGFRCQWILDKYIPPNKKLLVEKNHLALPQFWHLWNVLVMQKKKCREKMIT